MTSVTALFQITMNYLLHRTHVEHRKMRVLGSVAILFVPFGAFFLYGVSESVVMIALGCTVVAITGFGMVLTTKTQTILSSRPVAIGMTALSGIVARAFSTPGPVIIGYLYASDDNRLRAKANTQVFYVVITGAIVLVHTIGGGLNQSSLSRSLPYVPFVLLGTKLGADLSMNRPGFAGHIEV